jgi:hypothetical protein
MIPDDRKSTPLNGSYYSQIVSTFPGRVFLMFLQSPKKVNQGIKSEFSDAKN